MHKHCLGTIALTALLSLVVSADAAYAGCVRGYDKAGSYCAYPGAECTAQETGGDGTCQTLTDNTGTTICACVPTPGSNTYTAPTGTYTSPSDSGALFPPGTSILR
jgi:hypothetical protein